MQKNAYDLMSLTCGNKKLNSQKQRVERLPLPEKWSHFQSQLGFAF